MRIADLFDSGTPVFSFEFFPPRSPAGYASLYRTIEELKRLGPSFVSVTWGAGGSTRSKTVELVAQIEREIGLTAMAHLSCIGSTREQLGDTLQRLAGEGIQNVLALGGDRPPRYEPPPGGFLYANELAAFIRASFEFCLGGACYPETHPAAASPEADLENLLRKVQAGCEFLITQLFFDNRDYFRFVERARAAGIAVPIIPGIMPVTSVSNIRRMTALCGARIPEALAAELDLSGEDDARTLEVGVRWATRQCQELLQGGAPGIHFYTLNRSPATRRIFARLRASGA
jgi:methylenetetrahydrofolate reductase (NADPH)